MKAFLPYLLPFAIPPLALPVILVALLLITIWRLDSDIPMFFYEKLGRRPSSLKGKVIWIVGASSGIGEQLAYQLARAGCKIILSGTRTPKLDQVHSNCMSLNQNLDNRDILVLPFDVTDQSGHPEMLRTVLSHFGQLDIMVNNAGRYQFGRFEDTATEVDKKTFDINVFGLVNLTRLVVKHWLTNKTKGHLVVTSSVAGLIPTPTAAAYCASKHALQGYYDSLRAELGNRGIWVTLVCPGVIETELWGRAFTETPGEVKPLAREAMRIMPTTSAERCGQLYAVAIANAPAQAWIVRQPRLMGIYFNHYFPTLTRWLSTIGTPEFMVKKFLKAAE
ncbi:Dehydrogenase/reductase SDR family member 7 [Halotydeus destructor]|nr:Dehydrogenase/reductase SDR family member 7 [Halotydeus destructor]